MPRANINNVFRRNFYPIITTTCLVSLPVLLLWLVFIPHFPSFRVTSLTVSSQNFNTTTELTARFHVEGTLQNPNLVFSIWYESLNLVIWFNDSAITSVKLQKPQYSNEPKTNNLLQAQFKVAGSNFPTDAVREIAAQRHVGGSINFGVTLLAQLSFKFRGVDSRSYSFARNCYPLKIAFSPDDNMSKNIGIGRLVVAPFQCSAV